MSYDDCYYWVRSLDQDRDKALTMERIASVYCDIWKEPPWCEDFWSIEMVLLDMREFLSKRGARCFYTRPELEGCRSKIGEVVGFSWGYYMNREEFVAYSGNEKFPSGIASEEEVFYVAEVGVDKDWRQQSIAYYLSKALLSESGGKRILLRTDERALAAQALYKKLGFTKTSLRDSKHTSRLYWYK